VFVEVVSFLKSYWLVILATIFLFILVRVYLEQIVIANAT
jgi:hypothetical protein